VRNPQSEGQSGGTRRRPIGTEDIRTLGILFGGIKQSKLYKVMKGPSIDGVMGALDDMDLDFLMVHQRSCPNNRSGKVLCDRCIRVCPVDAIEFSRDSGLAIDTNECIRCGVCGAACPSGTLEPRDPSDEALLAKITYRGAGRGRDALVIRCDGIAGRHVRKDVNGKKRNDLVLSCLGRMTEVMSLTRRGRSVSEATFLPCDPECPFTSGYEGFLETERLTEHLMATFGPMDHNKDGQVGPQDVDGSKEKDPEPVENAYSRRDFFAQLRHATVGSLDPSKEKEKAPHWEQRVPKRRKALVDYARTLGCTDHVVNRDEGLPFGDPAVDHSLCDLCGVCASLCPTGALSTVEVDGISALVFTFWKCTGCTLCEDVCPEGAISLSGSYDLGRLQEDATILVKHTLESCPTCGMSYVQGPDASYCPHCDKRALLQRQMEESLLESSQGNSPGG
jgi:ferredoxin